MAEYFFVYDMTTGEERWKGYGETGAAGNVVLASGFNVINVTKSQYDGALADIPVNDLRQAIWEQVKARREALIDAGAPTSFGVMDADLVSRVNIGGASTAALAQQILAQPFSIVWTTRANTPVTLDASEMIQMGLEVMGFVNVCHGAARALRVTLDAASDVSTLLQIDISTGWPA